MEIKDLRQKEYEKLQREITDSMAEIASIEKFAITSSGAIYTWLLTKGLCVVPPAAFLIPVMLVGLFGALTYGLFERVKLIGAYIKRNMKCPPQKARSCNLAGKPTSKIRSKQVAVFWPTAGFCSGCFILF